MCRKLTLVLTLAVVAAVAIHAADLKSVWKSPDAGTIGFAGKKVAALVISSDEGLRISAEEALARQLVALGVKGVAAYRVVPREELRDKDKARAWFEKMGVEGVVAMRLVKAEAVTTYTPAFWTSGYYSSFWGYYDNTWVVVSAPGYLSQDKVVTVETTVFSVPRDKLLWAALSESTNPKNMEAFMKDLTTRIVKEMKKQGLTAKPR